MRITVTPATEEAVTLAEAKEHLRVIHAADDALIGRLVTAAREHVENETGRALVAATYRERFPVFDGTMQLPLWPVSAVASVSYLGGDGARVTVDPTGYVVESDWSTIGPLSAWPSPATSVVVEYTTAPADIPEALKQAILLRVQADYEADPDDAEKLRSAARNIAFPFRTNLGV
jgi:uncharacterized phiE125 gp8 family phage protein